MQVRTFDLVDGVLPGSPFVGMILSTSVSKLTASVDKLFPQASKLFRVGRWWRD